MSLQDLLKTAQGSTPTPQSQPVAKTPVASKTSGLSQLLTTAVKPSQQETKSQQLKQDTQPYIDKSNQANSVGGFLKNALVGAKDAVVNTTKGAIGGAMNVGNDIKNVITSPMSPKSINPYDWSQAGLNSLTNTEKDAGNRISDAISNFQDPNAGILKKATSIGEAGMGLVNGLFGVVTAPLAVLSNVPGVGHVVDVVNKVFGVLGAGGGDAAEGLINTLPISDSAKQTITPLAKEIGALTAQIAGGKAGEALLPEITAKSKLLVDHVKEAITKPEEKPIPEVPTKLPVKSLEETNKIPVSTPKTRQAEYAKSQGYEPYTPPEQLPEIQMGPKPKSDLPTIQIGDPIDKTPTKTGEFKYEPVKDTPVLSRENQVTKPAPAESIAQPNPNKAIPESNKPTLARENQIKTTAIEPQKATSKVARSIETKSVEKGITDGFKDLAGYDPVTIKDQSLRASNLMSRDIELAKRMVRGEVPMEQGLKPEMLIKAMEDYAHNTSDGRLARDIASSPLVSETSGHAQALRLLAERNPESAVARLKEIKDAREKQFEKKAGKTISKAKAEEVKNIKNEIKKSTPSKQTWTQFIDSIKC